MANVPLRGTLQKRHQNSRFATWGKRYFEVDDERGILYYFRTKAAHEWDEPARHLGTMTRCFFVLIFLCATQDIAVDGLALTILCENPLPPM